MSSKSDSGTPPAKSGRKGKIIAVALILLIGAGSGGGVWFYMKNQPPKKAEEVEVKKKSAPVFLPMDNFTVNLSDREHFLQVGLTFEVASSQIAEAIKQHMPILRGKILLLLASKAANELSTQEGKQKLIGELVAQAKDSVTDPAHQKGIETVHFSAFVIQ